MSTDQRAELPSILEPVSLGRQESVPAPQQLRHHGWFRRKPFLILISLVAIVGLVMAAGWFYLNWQFASINALSTPPPQVAGSVFDDAATAEVNTDFAQQALNAAQSGQPGQYAFDGQKLVLVTPTSASGAALAPENTATVIPEPTATTVPTIAPSPTADAFARAAAQATLQSAEFHNVPTPTMVPAPSPTTVPIEPTNTPVETPTVAATSVDSSLLVVPTATTGGLPELSVPDAASLPMPASFTLAPVVPSEQGQFNILLMGVDAREGQSIDVGVRPDSLSVLHLDPKTGSCRILAVPRDTRTELPGYGQSKVNHALAVGGVPYEILVVEQLLGIQIDHYGLIDFAGIQGLVDAVGGITVNNPEAFNHLGFSFAAGDIKLNGEQALVYARFRYDSRGDFGRIERQQQVIRAIIDEASGMDVVQSANSLLSSLEDHFKTDLSPTDLIGLAKQYRSSCTSETLQVAHLNGDVASYMDPLLNLNLSYVIVANDEIETKVEWLLHGD